MADITLSLGSKWRTATEEKEKQGQVIAHLTNQLEGLKSAYMQDVEQVEATRLLMEKMQAQMDIMAAERDEWKNAYVGVADKRKERDLLVENLMEQLRTLESTTRDEEVRASHAHSHASLLQKEKELLIERNRKQKAELDEAYTRLAFATDEMNTARDEQQALERTVQQLSTWRAAKDTQVASLVQEKTRLFRLVTDLRSTIKGGPGGNAAAAAASLNGSAAANAADTDLSASGSRTARRFSSAAALSSSAAASSTRALSSSRGSAANLIASALSGTGDRPSWSTLSGDGSSRRRRDVGPAGAPMTSDDRLDQLSLQGSVNSHAMIMRKMRRQEAQAQGLSQSVGVSNATSPSRSRTNLHASASATSLRSSSSQRQLQQQQQQQSDGDQDLEDAMYSPSRPSLFVDSSAHAPSLDPSATPRRRLLAGTHSSSEDEADQSQTAMVATTTTTATTEADARAAAAKQKLVLRLKRQIDLLEEKNRELEKAMGMLRGDNQLLLVRFRAAHERRVAAEKKLKQAQAELEEMRVTQQQQQHQQRYQQQQQSQQLQSSSDEFDAPSMQPQQQEYEAAYTNTQPTSPYNPARLAAAQAAAGRWK